MTETICATCHRAVRWGTRGGRLAWWHQDDRPDERITRDARIDAAGDHGHEPVLGLGCRGIDWAAVEAARAEHAVDENEQEDNRVFEIPPVEVEATEIFVSKDSPDPRMPGGAKDLINAVHKAGGRSLATYSRAPRIHGSHGNFLGMSDYVVVKFEVGPDESGPRRTGSARWEDGGLDVAYRTDYDHTTKTVTPTRVNSKPLRAWLVKGEWSDNA